MQTPPKIKPYYDRTSSPKSFDPTENKTIQHYRQETEINSVLENFRTRGIMPVGRRQPPQFIDATQLQDMDPLSAFDTVRNAKILFRSLPAEIRREIDNDPMRIYSWIVDPKNRPLAIKHGLIKADDTDVSSAGTDTTLDVTVPSDTKSKKEEKQ